jgi:AraC-like DNA-binding protein
MQIYREITPLEEPDVFVILDSYNNGFDYPIHNHPEFELNLVMGCSGTRIVGDSTELYFGQDLVLIGPYLFHKWDIDKSKGQGKSTPRVITIQFRLDLFNTQFFQKSQFGKIKKLLQDVSRGIKFHGKTFSKANEIMINLTTDNGFSGIVKFLQLLNLLSNSNETTFLSSEGFNPQAILSNDNRIQIAYGFILKNFHERDIKIREVAAQVNMSISAFSHLFKKYTNKSFMKFLIDVRIGNACRLLLDTSQNIKQICYSSGFNNVANFNRLFKKYRSCTPFEFRRRSIEKDSFDLTKQITHGQFLPSGTSIKEAFKPSEYTTTKVIHF